MITTLVIAFTSRLSWIGTASRIWTSKFAIHKRIDDEYVHAYVEEFQRVNMADRL